MLPTIQLAGKPLTRLIIGGNQVSGFSHWSGQRDAEMLSYYSAENVLRMWQAAWENGINTIQLRGDRHVSRLYLEHRERGGKLQWIAQTASEWRDLAANVRYVARFQPIAIYIHGTYADHLWHHGRISEVGDIVKAIKDAGLPAGVGTHMPNLLDYAENAGWETDFYMCCFYNLSRREKQFVATAADPYATEEYLPDDPAAMTAMMRKIPKPCLGFKILAAGRKCASEKEIREAFTYAFANIKPTDTVVVGAFQKSKDQVAENARIAREVLAGMGFV